MTEASYLDSDYCTSHSQSRSDRSNQRSYDQHSGPVCDVFFSASTTLNLPRASYFSVEASEHEKNKNTFREKIGILHRPMGFLGGTLRRKSERGSGPLPDGQPSPPKNLELFVVGDFFYESYHGKSP